MLFKIMNQLVELPSGDLLIPSCIGTRRNFGSFKQAIKTPFSLMVFTLII